MKLLPRFVIRLELAVVTKQGSVGMLLAVGSGKSKESSSAMTMSHFSFGARLSTR
ncbi:vacuolar ATP synthase subunit B [Iris pallida]|uniref:Vacuolar ATP synthase subunit B n=1 Tax=Iris pallida TaxID=29817 RepID=A0AAX6GA52_IRIPA|nr:vacuolar ATP synthase subunit B [Iris pallida]KAJ6825539.1 vacuolar ATP synthase subunit B [Iris pallida]